MQWLKPFIIVLCIFSCAVDGLSQRTREPEPESRDTTQQPQKRGILEEVTDTTYAPQVFLTARDFYHSRPYIADSLGQMFHQYDEIRQQEMNHAHLGNLGSPQRARFYSTAYTKGLDYGQHQFDLYRRDFANFRFISSETAITQFRYAQGIRQTDAKFSALFAKNFANGIKATVEYRRVNQAGLFSYQRVKNTNLGVGIWYDAPGGKYDGLYHYSSNSFVQQDNGGIEDYDQLETATQPDIVFVRLNSALTTHRERALSVQNHFHINRPGESGTPAVLVDLIHSGQYKNGFIKFADDNISRTADYYRGFITDSRGVRHFIDYKTFDNRADIQFRFGNSTNDISKHVLRAGIQYRTTSLNQEPVTGRINELFINASGRFTIAGSLFLRGNGYIALAGQAGDFMIDPSLNYHLRPLDAQLIAGIRLYDRSPNILEKRFFVSQTEVWQNDFKKLNHSELYFEADIRRWKLNIKGSFTALTNYIFFDENRLPVQFEGTGGIAQISVSKEFNIGKFGLIGTAGLQNVPDQLRLPGIIAKAQVFFTDYWFGNNLRVRFGGDLRITDQHDAVNYFPLTGQFHIDNSRTIQAYPALDAFLDFEVRETFRAFVKFENFTAYFFDGPYMHVIDYPQFNTYFRFGFWMKLFG